MLVFLQVKPKWLGGAVCLTLHLEQHKEQRKEQSERHSTQTRGSQSVQCSRGCCLKCSAGYVASISVPLPSQTGAEDYIALLNLITIIKILLLLLLLII